MKSGGRTLHKKERFVPAVLQLKPDWKVNSAILRKQAVMNIRVHVHQDSLETFIQCFVVMLIVFLIHFGPKLAPFSFPEFVANGSAGPYLSLTPAGKR